MSTRKLASIQVVDEIRPIPESPRLVVAVVLGWNCVTRKDEVKVGQRVIYVEIDSVLPDGPIWSEFMRGRKFLVKTTKIRGTLSQGLVLPLHEGFETLETGTDVTEMLGITKFVEPEDPAAVAMAAAGCVESEPWALARVPKTDEVRVQARPEVREALLGLPYAVTLKMDGTSFTASYDEAGKFVVCSRNQSMGSDGPNIYRRMAVKYDLERVLKGTPLAIQGEICGPKIQKNPLRLTEPDLFVFTVYDWKRGRRYNPWELVGFCAYHELKTVPLLEVGYDFKYSSDELLDKAKGEYSPGVPREGIVVRGFEGVSFKVINNDYLA